MKPPKYAVRGAAAAGVLMLMLALAACASPPPSLVPGPVSAAPPLAPMFIERRSNGAIWQPQLEAASLFSGERRPQAVGDTMKVDIAESLKASQKRATDTSRDNKQAVKGPGNGDKNGGLFDKILNVDANAGSSDSFKGSGSTEVATEFSAQLTVSVINVLPNGHLVVAGERRIGVNGGASALRFSGIVNPQDIRLGNIVSSRDVANAALESAGSGDVSEAASRSWLQRVMAKTLAVW
ncbi:flagellar basal body L-ring protein FlgH [Rhizobacter sp. SG703]|uniref:flagellar basal body L-ring protein FlgH n=1 Tax=Rhizobacter sp. SG703 TaxID=2587140 RepID=UPI00182F2C51|nr:flagellar basal body L-ring protein FlgH [Rhizobacter sp. SG703]NKI95252.1 flagellar L-ring protein precursor FlgH [Rhizobacter sp. SG703]